MSSLSIKDAQYILSAPTLAFLPPSDNAQVAFVGRSNVGKSSLLNFLVSRKNLARISRTPGRTRALNLFSVTIIQKNEEGAKSEKKINFIDLPGTGYARLSCKQKTLLSETLSNYLDSNQPIRMVFHLLDCRRKPNSEDIDLGLSLRQSEQNYIAVITKIDEIPVSKRKPLMAQFAKDLSINPTDCIMASSHACIGRDMLLLKIWEHVA
jgi:GTP-binding protein